LSDTIATDTTWLPQAYLAFEWIVRLALAGRIIMLRRPVPVSLAWLCVVAFLPVIGLVSYLLIGENRMGRRRMRRYDAISQGLEAEAAKFWRGGNEDWTVEEQPYHRIAWLTGAVTGMPPLRGNSLRLLGGSEATIKAIIEDIDKARSHIHMLFYIWMVGGAGDAVGQAIIRAAERGVECRVLVDAVGSRAFLRSPIAASMRGAGVRLAGALAVSPLRMLFNRLDLRNHRKIVAIDGTIAYTGSQNITDGTFNQKARVGEWIDAMVRVQGPAAQALEVIFLRDWHMDVEEPTPLGKFLPDFKLREGGSVVQVVPSGPGQAPMATHRAILEAMYTARHELIITTPYFVPDDATLAAMESASMRGVRVTLVVPQRNDAALVAAASRAAYIDLLRAGVRILEYRPGLLHSKTLTVDSDVALIGSANLDMRSFSINLEINLFVFDSDFTSQVRFLQTSYIEESDEVSLDQWLRRPVWTRVVENSARMLGPLL
jgi:cardiolipin synthase